MILVTGGAGFIGSNFVQHWLAHSDEAVLDLDKLTYAGNLESLAALQGDPRHVCVKGDIGDRALVEGLLARIPGPDFPTAGFICGRAGIRQAYTTGRGQIVMRARAEKCQTAQDAIRLRSTWISTTTKAQEAGRPISEDVQNQVAELIDARQVALTASADQALEREEPIPA